ncbi:MAG: hypothetical protein JO076_08950 [Verrucomicrobia bacterium]|nr:hypothetical protein [Verrucomicrobiota bacterium]
MLVEKKKRFPHGVCHEDLNELEEVPGVIDALRPFTQKIWQKWDWAERRKFVRHLRAYWEPHRHRASPEALAIKKKLESSGRLVGHRGRLLSRFENVAGLEVEFVEFRQSEPKWLQVSSL